MLQVQVSPEVLEFQAKLGDRHRTVRRIRRTAKAFVADRGEVNSPAMIDWVEKYLPNQIGAGKYFPHLTAGVDTFDHLKIIEAEPFDAFDVNPRASRCITSATTAPPASCSRSGRAPTPD